MQVGQPVDRQCATGAKVAIETFRGRLAVLRRLGNGGQQRRLNEAEVEVRDALRHTDIGIVHRTWMCRRARGLQPNVERNGGILGFIHGRGLICRRMIKPASSSGSTLSSETASKASFSGIEAKLDRGR